MNINQEKEKLLRNLFQAIDMLDCTESKETIAQAAIRIYDLKREIIKVDPTWRVRLPYNYYVQRNSVTPRWSKHKRKPKYSKQQRTSFKVTP